MEVIPKRITEYLTPDGNSPFRLWIDQLQDKKARMAVFRRIEWLAMGNAGDYRYLTDGVFELRIHLGPGYRIYYGQTGTTIILLLCGGEKSTQHKDIDTAKRYLNDYRRKQ